MLAQDTFGNRSSLSVLTCMQMFSTKQLWREILIDVSRIILRFSKDNEVEQTTKFLTIKLCNKSFCFFFLILTILCITYVINIYVPFCFMTFCHLLDNKKNRFVIFKYFKYNNYKIFLFQHIILFQNLILIFPKTHIFDNCKTKNF